MVHELGDLLFAATNVARLANVDPELALRAAAARFRERVETAERLAAEAGEDWAGARSRGAGRLVPAGEGGAAGRVGPGAWVPRRTAGIRGAGLSPAPDRPSAQLAPLDRCLGPFQADELRSCRRRSTLRRRRGPSVSRTPSVGHAAARPARRRPRTSNPPGRRRRRGSALRAAAGRFRDRVETAERLAAEAGADWAGLGLEASGRLVPAGEGRPRSAERALGCDRERGPSAEYPAPNDDRHRLSHRARDPRLAGQSDRRGRCPARVRRIRAGGGAVGRVHRRARGRRAARRRPGALRRQGRAAGRGSRQLGDRVLARRHRCHRPAPGRRHPGRARRVRQQGQSGRERDPGGIARDGEGRRRRRRAWRSTATSAAPAPMCCRCR